MAHIQKRARGGKIRWVGRYRASDGRERTKTFDRKIDAERWVATQTASQAKGEWVDPALGRQTFAEYVAELRTQPQEGRRTTRARKDGIIDLHLLPRFGGMPLAKITVADVKLMVVDQLAEGYAPSTVLKHVQVLSGILQSAVVDEKLGRNVAAVVKVPGGSKRRLRFLTPEQVRALAEEFPPYYRALIFVAAWIGLRWGELAGLRVENVDVLRKTITVVEQVTSVAGYLEFGPVKTASSVRTVAIPGYIAEMLAEHMTSPAVKSSGMVFPTKNGKVLRAPNFRRRWNPRVEKLFAGTDAEGLVFHELRHTAAALAIAEGAHPLTIKERLGHSSITVTMDTYGHLFPAQDQALADALDGTLRSSVAGPMRDRENNVLGIRAAKGV